MTLLILYYSEIRLYSLHEVKETKIELNEE